MKFRKKPVVIEAVQWNNNPHDLAMLVEDSWRSVHVNQDGTVTINGIMTVRTGDWILKGVHGELTRCKPDIFEQRYEVVDDD